MPDDFESLREIDEAIRGIHPHLTATDEVLFWREYTSGRDWSFGDANNFIGNLKKKPTSSEAVLRHKARAIRECSSYFSKAINPVWIREAIFVPVPCSKVAGHAEYDDRMTKVCNGIKVDNDHATVRELVYQSESLTASHTLQAGQRHTVQDLLDVYKIDEDLIDDAPTRIAVVDDVLTNGTHFRAMKTVLLQKWPNARVVGFFVARRIFPTVAPEDFEF